MKYTKDQLEGISDFELSKMILKIKAQEDGEEINKMRHHRLAGKLKCFSHGVVFNFGDGSEGQVDFCNNWADMGSLIDSMQTLRLYTDESGLKVAYAFTNDGKCVHEAKSNKLTRSAAIVYILMQGVE